jgi:hypothetical protein
MYGQPNYSPYQVPSQQGLLSFLDPFKQQLLTAGSGGDIAEMFDMKAGTYGGYFSPFSMEGINKTLESLPQLQQFGYGQARQNYMSGLGNIQNRQGQTGLASTGSFKNDYTGLNNEFSNNMFSTDKEIQNLISGLRDQLTSGVGSVYDTIGMLRGSGVNIGSNFGG